MSEEHRFWSHQPVDVSDGNEIISIPDRVSDEAPRLPPGFSFGELSDTEELSRFLEKNYVEDVHEGHVLAYSPEFLRWMLRSNREKGEYNLVLRWNGEMVGFASAKEHTVVIRGVRGRVASVNLLCVSRDLRGRRFAPVIIKEITRRVNRRGIYQAVFTSGTELFFNVASSHYYHRALNAMRLFKTGFSSKTTQPGIPRRREGTRIVTREDMACIQELVNREAGTYTFHEEMSVEEVVDNMEPVENVVYTYVHEEGGLVEEFGTFFVIETVEKQSGERIKGAYLYYRSSKNVREMVGDLIYFAHSEGCDVFNCLDVMGNKVFLDELGFERGTGMLRYYLYNWRTQQIDPSEVFFVLH